MTAKYPDGTPDVFDLETAERHHVLISKSSPNLTNTLSDIEFFDRPVLSVSFRAAANNLVGLGRLSGAGFMVQPPGYFLQFCPFADSEGYIRFVYFQSPLLLFILAENW